MTCFKQIWKYIACALTLISAPLWAASELPVLPATVAVQGLSLHIDPLKSVYDAETGFSGAGTMFFPALGKELSVTYTHVKLNANAQWQSGSVKASIAPDLLKAAAIGDIVHPKFVGNFDGLKGFIRAARSHIDELPLMLNTLPTYQKADFGSLAVMLTEINVSKEGTTAAMMALERMPEGIYLPFTRTGIPFNPLSARAFEETQLALTATADVSDYQMPVTFKAGDVTGSIGTYVTFDCNGLKVFHVEGFHKFTLGIITPSPASAPPVVASFSADVKSLRQFVAKVTIPKFTIAGFDDIAFEIKDAIIDYSDSENPTTLPEAYFKEMGSTAPTKKETWKGVYVGSVAISLPSMPMRDKDGNAFSFGGKDMIYDKGNGFSATFFVKTTDLANINVKGFRLILDEFNLRLKKNSMQDLNFLGRMSIPVLKDEKGSLNYKASFNVGGDTTKPGFQLAVQFADGIALEVPLLELAKCELKKTSVLSMQMRNGKPLVFANLHGSFGIKMPSIDFGLGLPFEGWKIGDDPSLPTRSGDEELPMNFKAFDTNGSATAATPEKKMSGFPMSIDNIGFTSDKGVYRLKMDIGLTLCGKFEAKGGLVILSKLNFGKLATLKPWEGIDYQGAELESLLIDANLSAFRIRGELAFLKNDPTYGKGYKGALKMDVKAGKGFTVNAEAIFGNKNDFSYFYVDGNLTVDKGIPLVTPLFLYTFGGGMYWNMEQTVVNGKYKYVPKKGVKGFQARVGIGLARRETFDAVGELQFEFGAEWELRFFKIRVTAGMLNDIASINPSALNPYTGSKVAAFCEFRYDNMNKNITVTAEIKLQNLPNFEGKGNMVMFFDLNDKDNWYVRIGTPKNPISIRLVFPSVRAGMYMMMGKGIGDLPSIVDVVPDLAAMLDIVKPNTREDFNKKGSMSSTGSGFAFGISMKLEENFSFLMFSGGVNAAFGIDVMMRSGNECNGAKMGWNGWVLSGQAYAYLAARVDIKVKLLFIKGTFNIATLKVGALLQAQLPEPLLLSGRLAGYFSILGGVVSGKFSVGFEIKKAGACKVQTFPTSPAVGQPIVASTYPAADEVIQIFDDVIVSTNLAVQDVQTYEFTNQDGVVSRHFYKVRLVKVDVMQGTKVLASIPTADIKFKDDFTFILTPRTALPEKQNLELRVYGEGYDTEMGGNILKTVGRDTAIVKFKTGPRPEKVYPQMVSYSAPGADQKYWYKGYAAPKVSLKQNGYDYLFEPNPKGVPSEYKWILYKMQGTDLSTVGTYDLSSTFQGSDTISVTAANSSKCGNERTGTRWVFRDSYDQYRYDRAIQIGWTWQAEMIQRQDGTPVAVYAPRICTYDEVVKSRSFTFDKLNELTLEKKATYRIEVVRRPKDLQLKAIGTTKTDSTKTVLSADGENETKMATRSLAVKKGNAQEIAIIYTNTFSMSQFNDVTEKMKVNETAYNEYPNSLGQPGVGSTNNLDGDLRGGGYRPYVSVVGTTEPLDQYDIQLIAANSTVAQSSAGLEFSNSIKSNSSYLKGMSGSEWYLGLMACRVGSGRDEWYHDKIMNASLNNFVRTGSSGVELVFNSVNIQRAQSNLMMASANAIIKELYCREECRSAPKWYNLWNTECSQVCYEDQSQFTRAWMDWQECQKRNDWFYYCESYASGQSRRRYQWNNYRVQGTFTYNKPSAPPSFFTKRVSGKPQTYKVNFVPQG